MFLRFKRTLIILFVGLMVVPLFGFFGKDNPNDQTPKIVLNMPEKLHLKIETKVHPGVGTFDKYELVIDGDQEYLRTPHPTLNSLFKISNLDNFNYPEVSETQNYITFKQTIVGWYQADSFAQNLSWKSLYGDNSYDGTYGITHYYLNNFFKINSDFQNKFFVQASNEVLTINGKEMETLVFIEEIKSTLYYS